MTEFLAANWLWLSVLGLMVLMHPGGFGCGAHGRRHRHTASEATDIALGCPQPPQDDVRSSGDSRTPPTDRGR